MLKSTPIGGLLRAGSDFIYKAKRPTFYHNLFPGASEKRSRRGIFERQCKPDIRHVQPFLVPNGDQNELKAKPGFRPRRMVRSSMRLPILGEQRTLYLGGGGGGSGSVCYPVQLSVFFSRFHDFKYISKDS